MFLKQWTHKIQIYPTLEHVFVMSLEMQGNKIQYNSESHYPSEDLQFIFFAGQNRVTHKFTCNKNTHKKKRKTEVMLILNK